jgi:hypothetical protein
VRDSEGQGVTFHQQHSLHIFHQLV